MLALRFASSISVFAIVLCAARCEAQQGKESTPTADKFALVYGAKIHYVETGTGAPLILIHGLADDVAVWDSVISPLAARFRVVALDQIGFGRSDKPLLSYRVSTFVDFLDGFLNELKIERASLVGNSFGGWIAAAFTLAHPERVERLVLCDAAGYGTLAQTMDRRALSALKLASRDDIRYLGPLRQRVAAGDSYTISQVLDSMTHGEDVLDNRLAVIKQPTLVLWGREDKLIPLSFGERFHKEIAGSRLRIIDNCGHMPHVECPKEFATAALQFLSDKK